MSTATTLPQNYPKLSAELYTKTNNNNRRIEGKREDKKTVSWIGIKFISILSTLFIARTTMKTETPTTKGRKKGPSTPTGFRATKLAVNLSILFASVASPCFTLAFITSKTLGDGRRILSIYFDFQRCYASIRKWKKNRPTIIREIRSTTSIWICAYDLFVQAEECELAREGDGTQWNSTFQSDILVPLLDSMYSYERKKKQEWPCAEGSMWMRSVKWSLT